MPKSRRSKGKYSAQAKRKKGSPSRPPVAVQQQAVAQPQEAAPISRVPAPSAGAPTPASKVASLRYPYVTTELRTIGILAAIMLTILIVLSLVLS